MDSRSEWMRSIEQARTDQHVRGRQTFDTMRVAAAPFRLIRFTLDLIKVPGTARSVMYRVASGRPDGKGYLLIDFGEDALMPDTCWSVVRFWCDFFRLWLPHRRSRRADIMLTKFRARPSRLLGRRSST